MGREQSTMEDMELKKEFWRKKRVFITGHTGFKGTWLQAVLEVLGSKVIGFSKDKRSSLNSCLDSKNWNNLEKEYIDDIKNADKLKIALYKERPNIIIHMAAQPLVMESYKNPMETWRTNVGGTINLLEIIRNFDWNCTVCIVTTDKVYRDNKQGMAHKEEDSLGGEDVYSASKAACEIATHAWKKSFLEKEKKEVPMVKLLTVRAGNVIGGGDLSENRIIPDLVRSLLKKERLTMRKPNAVRPWQYVLTPLVSYLMLIQIMEEVDNIEKYEQISGSYNIGPEQASHISVERLVNLFIKKWGESIDIDIKQDKRKETELLNLDTQKIKSLIKTGKEISIEDVIGDTVKWYKRYFLEREDPYTITIEMVKEYLEKTK